MEKRADSLLSLNVRGPAMRSFCLLTGNGFNVDIQTACTLRELLCGKLAIEPAYLETRIQIVFLNSKVVDDLTTAIVTAGSAVGLSGPMPGIAGAMLRKGSRLSSMRSSISHVTQNSQPATKQAGDVTVRLFNVLQQELGPSLLERGVCITGKVLADFLRRQMNTVRSAVNTAEMDGKAVPVSAVYTTDWTHREVHLRVAACS